MTSDSWELALSDITNEKFLGRGSYGEVYLVDVDDEKYAVKCFRKEIEIKYFDVEVKQLSRVHHQNIIKFLDSNENQKSKFIVMEYADGGSLDAYLHNEPKKPYDQALGLSWAQQCAQGVAYLHSMHPKVLHRDLKPANLLLTHNYTQIKICDFGTVAELKTTMSNARGTAAYMAPEVYGATRYDEKCDVFSWGILTWEILSREVPFKECMNDIIVLDNIRKGERPRLFDDWPRYEKILIQLAWDKDSCQRPNMKMIARCLHKKGYIPIDPLLSDITSGKLLGRGSYGEVYAKDVVSNNIRDGRGTALNADWPEDEKRLMKSAWDKDPHMRPAMNIIAGCSHKKIEEKTPNMLLSDITNEISLCFPKSSKFSLKLLGRGSYGEVYLVDVDGEKKAVKCFWKETERNYFDVEVKQLSRVDHQNIIQFFGSNKIRKSKFIVMEYADGGSLHAYLHNEPKKFYDLAQGLSWARQCAEGVAYLHSMQLKPVLHRDLKSANLLLTHNYTKIKICDFGTVAELKATLTNNRGTAAYMAPEVYGGTRYDEKCDVFSWGILTWEILSREDPLKECVKEFSIAYKISKGPSLRLFGDLPIYLKKIIQWSWDRDPRKRPTMGMIACSLEEERIYPWQ